MTRNARTPHRFTKTSQGLYLLTPPQVRLEGQGSFPDLLAQALQGGEVACLQIRLKFAENEAAASSKIWKDCVDALLPLTKRHGVTLLLNDEIGLAKELGVDGVHIGQEDGSVAQARAAVGEGIVGVTCHDSLDLAHKAEASGADYVAFGSFFASKSKPTASPASKETLMRWRQEGGIPGVAIGGITPRNGGELLRAGADYLAVCESVWGHPESPGAAVSEFAALFAEASR